MKISITAKNQINFSLSYETAAWYKELTVIPGEYSIERSFNQQTKKPIYIVKYECEIVSDNFQSLFGGNAVGERYDTAKNAGKKETHSKSYTASKLLVFEFFQHSPEAYKQLLEDAKAELEYEIDILMRCLNDSNNKKSFHWMTGHSKQLADASALYETIWGVLARRDYNESVNGKGWSEKELYVKA